MTNEQILQEFTQYLTRKSYAPLSISSYLQDIKLITDYYPNNLLTTLTEKKITQFLLSMIKQEKKTSSIQRYNTSLLVLTKFLKEMKLISTEINWSIKIPKKTKSLPKTIDKEEIFHLLSAFTPKTTKEYRDKAIIELLYSTGIRVQELINLNIEHIDLKETYVFIDKGKGGHQRYVPIGSYAINSLNAWLALHPKPYPSIPLFTSTHTNRLQVRSVQYLIKKYVEKYLNKNDISPHYFRHSFASHLLESSQNIRGVQQMLGHKNLNTTQIYTELNFNYLANIYDQCHPKSQIRKKRKE